MNTNCKVSSEISAISHLNRIKAAIRKWKLSDCLCRLCRKYLDNVEFILAPSKN